jgi:hypothetical protein
MMMKNTFLKELCTMNTNIIGRYDMRMNRWLFGFFKDTRFIVLYII